MARARNIKPSFFMNENIVELSIEARLLFIGLWTLADREGRLENRPRKIKMSLFPADEINVSELLSNISKYGFIELYNIDGMDIIQILNFVKHQTPHGLEKDSDLPDQNGMYTVYERSQKNKTVVGKPKLVNKSELNDFYSKTGLFSTNIDTNNGFNSSDMGIQNGSVNNTEQDNNSYKTVSISDQNALNPESFNLNPESFNKNTCPSNDEPVPEKPKSNFKNEIQEIFEFWKTTFNKNNRTLLDDPRKKKVLARLKQGYSVEDIKRAIVGYSKSQFHIEGNHTDLSLICRDSAHLEKFLDTSQQGGGSSESQSSATEQPVFEPVRVVYGQQNGGAQ